VSRLAYLDCAAGLAGDMLVGALVDAGGDESLVRSLPKRLGLDGIEARIDTVERAGMRALLVSFEGAERAGSELRPSRLRELVDRGDLAEEVRSRAVRTLERLVNAEASVHGVPPQDVALHELGTPDTVLDICAAVELVADLGIEHVICSPLPLGLGAVSTAHGRLPLPSPAVLALLEGAPVVGADQGELVTPTGAALAAELAEGWGRLPPLTLETVGAGAGTRSLADRPNVVRLIVGAGPDPLDGIAPASTVSLLETNLDDMVPELIPDAVERCLAAGALDVWTVPAHMKKGRPGVIFSALARIGNEAAVAGAILEQTSALGVRVQHLQRYELERDHVIVRVDGHEVRVKLGRMGGRTANLAPEHDDCAAVARATGRSVKAVWEAALAEAMR